MRVLGVILRQDLRRSSHIEVVLSKCSSSMYALGVLRSHGLPPASIREVAKITTISQLMYASSAWWGYTSAADRHSVEQLITRMKRMGLIGQDAPEAAALAEEADFRLFTAVRSNTGHVLHRLFPPHRSQTRYELRRRGHDYQLPAKDDRNFIS